jgi:hypothetical protein
MDNVPSDSEQGGSADIETDDTKDKAKIDFEERNKIVTSDLETEKCKSSDDVIQLLMFSGFCKALLEQSFPRQSGQLAATDDVLPYRAALLWAALLAGLAELLQVLNSIPDMDDSLVDHQIAVYRMIVPTMLAMIDAEKQANVTVQKMHLPFIIARSIDCLSCAMWKGIGSSSSSKEEEVHLLLETMQAFLSKSLQFTARPVWHQNALYKPCRTIEPWTCSSNQADAHLVIASFGVIDMLDCNCFSRLLSVRQANTEPHF